MTARVLDFEQLSTEMDVQAAEEFVRANVSRQLGIDGDGAADVIAALDAQGEGAVALADALRKAQAEPLDLTLWELLYLAMSVGRVPVVSLPKCEHPATNPEMAAAMREYDADAGRE